MKIIQTYWSLPSQKNQTDAVEGRNSGGFVSEKHHAMSWALSCLKFKQFYKDVKLYTDKAGSNWLVNELNLPYTDVDDSLDCINHYNPLLWALPKVHVYGLQNDPFIHADGDVYIWKPLEEELLKQPLVVQSPDDNAKYMRKILEQIVKVFTTIPPYLRNGFDEIIAASTLDEIPYASINAGIFGGNDISFIKKYTAEAMKFVEDNIDTINRIDVGPFNIIFEQLLFKLFAQKNGMPIRFLFDEESRSNIFLSSYYFLCVPQKYSFIHLFGPTKRVALQYKQMEFRLKQEFPSTYQHINKKYEQAKTYTLNSFSKESNEVFVDMKQSFKYTLALLERIHVKIDEQNFKQFFAAVENIIETDSSDTALLLSDIFQIEKITQHINYDAIDTDFNAVEELVAASYTDAKYLLNNHLEFCLNTQNTGIAYLYHHFIINVDESDFLEKIFNTDKLPLLNGETNKLFIQKLIKDGVEKIKYEYLEDWDILLPLFDGNYLTIKEVIEEVKQNNMVYDGADIESDIVDFIFHSAFNRNVLSFRKRR